MTMERLDAAKRLAENQDPTRQFAIDQAKYLLISAGVKDPGPKESILKSSETPVESKAILILSKDSLILPDTVLLKEVSDILQKAEKAGIGVFEAHHLSDVILDQSSNVPGWDKKPEAWYWEQIKTGKVSQDAPKLPDSWVLIDKTQKPDYKDGRQMYENDAFGPIISKLRKDKKIQSFKGVPESSRFNISHDELTQVVLPEIAKLLGVEASQVRLPKAIEFNVIGNLKHSEWGNTTTWEWFADKFGDDHRLHGGYSGHGGLAHVHYYWSDSRCDVIGFRPLVVVPTKA